MRLNTLYSIVCGLLIGYAPVAAAQNTLDLSGNTTGAPTDLLPLFGSTPESCTLAGEAEPYQLHTFHVDTDASYTVSIVDPIDDGTSTDWTALFFYTDAFVPGSACTNFVAVGNEVPGAGLTTSLVAEQTYVLAVAGLFGVEDAYTVRISGPEGSTVTSGELPVELTRFDARRDGDDVLLAWTTASETNNAGFGVEMQASGGAWREHAFVPGHGTKAEAAHYTQRIPALQPGTYRFRLRQVDFDGAAAYSPEVEVAVTLDVPYHFTAPQPNPSGGSTRLMLAVREAQQVRVAVYDLTGREVAVLFDGPLAASETHALAFDASAWPAGTYLLRATAERFTATQRLTVVR